MQLQKDIDWEFPTDANNSLHDCDTINIISSQRYIPLLHLIHERVKYPCDTICTVMSQGHIPLRQLNLRGALLITINL